jgi:hypothetical protein
MFFKRRPSSVQPKTSRSRSLRRGRRSGRRPWLETLEDRTLLSVTLHSNFKGLDTNDAGGVIEPPDPIAAAGPADVVELVNSNIAFYNKTNGKQLSSEGLDAFFAPVDSVDSFFSDVSVTYDEQAGRFFVSTMDIDFFNVVAYYDFAVSNDSNPMDGFTEMHQLNITETSPITGETLFSDFPRLGWNADAYVVQFNMYGFQTEYQYHTQLVTIDKASVLDQNPATLTYYQVDRPLPNSTLVPAVMHGTSPGDPLWLVEEKGYEQDGSLANLRVVEMTNVLSATPTFTDSYVPVTPYTITPFPGDTQGQITTTLDTRILSVDWRNNQMVITQNVGVAGDPNVHAQWYEVSTGGSGAALVQEGAIGVGSGADTYMASAALAPDGSIGMTYIESSPTENMSMYVTGQAPGDPAGTMETPALVKSGEMNYNGTRVGDFSGITLDPSTGTSFWAVNEYAITSGDPSIPNWGTWIANFSVPAASPGSLSGQVFNDLNGDGIDENEPGINGVTIDLYDANGKFQESTVTATGPDGKDGDYAFANLTPASYSVTEEVPSGWVATTPTTVAATVVSGQDTGGLLFGEFQQVTISGTVFNDLNDDRSQENGEPGIPGVVVTLNNGQNATTDANGNYSITAVGPGSFTVTETVPAQYMETAPVGDAYSVTTASGVNIVNQTFADVVPTATLDAAPGVPGYFESGRSWYWLNQGWKDGKSRLHDASSTAATAGWIFAKRGGLPVGKYEIFFTYASAAGRATSAQYTLRDGATTLGSPTVDQTKAPLGGTYQGFAWTSFGFFTINHGRINVILSDNANGSVDADGVLIVYAGKAGTSPSDASPPGSNLAVATNAGTMEQIVNALLMPAGAPANIVGSPQLTNTGSNLFACPQGLDGSILAGRLASSAATDVVFGAMLANPRSTSSDWMDWTAWARLADDGGSPAALGTDS